MAVTIRPVSAEELVPLVPGLADLLIDVVQHGASMGFFPSVTVDEGRSYWLSLGPELRRGTRVLVGAFRNDRIVGAGQLTLPSWPNARHRAELQKLLVDSTLQGRGVGRLLMTVLHATARQRGRSLILLNTREGRTERFYKNLGYKEVGVIPGYSVGPAGERIDSVTL